MSECEPRMKAGVRRKPTKAARDRAELRETRRALLERSQGRCEGRGFSDLCTGVGVEIHHVLKRSRGGTNDPADCVLLCRFCHAKTEDAPAAALAAGLLRPSWEDA